MLVDVFTQATQRLVTMRSLLLFLVELGQQLFIAPAFPIDLLFKRLAVVLLRMLLRLKAIQLIAQCECLGDQPGTSEEYEQGRCRQRNPACRIESLN